MVRPLALLALVACAATPFLPLRPDLQPPEGSTTEVFTARDGTQLLARHWATAEAPKAVVVIMHGLKDYSARYAELANELVASGYAVYAFDLRGHGRSAGPRVAPDDWFDYVDDLDRFLTSVEQREPGKPVFLFGHSMGGLIAGLAAERHRPRLAGLIVSGPALAIDANPLLVPATRLGGLLAPGSPGLKLPNSDFSSAAGAEAAMDADPLVSQGGAPTRTAVGLIDGMGVFWRHLGALTMPLLALHGSADKLTAPTGSRLLVDWAPSRDKTLHIYPGFFHDLVHEPKGAEVRAEIAAWITAHVASGEPMTTAIAPPSIYSGSLAGDPSGLAESVMIAGGVGRSPTSAGGNADFSGRFAIDAAFGRRVGFAGSLTLRTLVAHKSAALRPLGIGFKISGNSVIALSVGASIIGGQFEDTGGSLGASPAFAAGLTDELGIGPLHVSLFADYDRLFSRNETFYDFGIGIRAGRDRHYWPRMRAGVGPVLILGGVADPNARASGPGLFVLAGLQLFGAD